MTAQAATSFVPPSPGSWELEQTHMTRPLSVVMHGVFPENMMRGFADGTRAYGILLDHMEVAIINGFTYTAPRPVGAPKGAKGPPPRLMFEVLRRLHPEIRRCRVPSYRDELKEELHELEELQEKLSGLAAVGHA